VRDHCRTSFTTSLMELRCGRASNG
jgi:hypothetical protein